jgi:D-alanyl-D-alanine dipeptidase
MFCSQDFIDYLFRTDSFCSFCTTFAELKQNASAFHACDEAWFGMHPMMIQQCVMKDIKYMLACAIMVILLPINSMAQKKSKTAQSMVKQGMVNVKDKDASLFVSLMYSRADNFTGRVLYGDLRDAYLHPEAARAVAKAQKRLKELHPGLSLIIYDACRPMSIQRKMWNAVKGTPKYYYVSNPAHGGGLHNYGLAVDISICNLKGDTVPMGTKIDYMGVAAHIDNEAHLVNMHKISRTARKNRLLLRSVMRYAGFRPLRTEWWHFNLKSRNVARKHYKAVY